MFKRCKSGLKLVNYTTLTKKVSIQHHKIAILLTRYCSTTASRSRISMLNRQSGHRQEKNGYCVIVAMRDLGTAKRADDIYRIKGIALLEGSEGKSANKKQAPDCKSGACFNSVRL